MNQFLFSLSVGPVQSFIAASRKTRDLKTGSDLLMQMVGRVINEALVPARARFIFPAVPEGASAGESEIRAANIILCVLPEDPARMAERCKEVARSFLVQAFDDCKRTKQIPEDKQVLAHKQLESFPEVFCAWAPMNGNYPAAHKKVMALLAARKALRDFGPSPGDGAVPKSPLDPSYETILPLTQGWRLDIKTPEMNLQLKERETLDAISFLKRFRSRDPFPSNRKVAVMDLLADRAFRNELEEFCKGQDFDEGDVIFDTDDIPGEQKEEAKKKRSAFLDCLPSNERPRPYYAVLIADGDSMGKYLDHLKEEDGHRAFSRKLGSEFCDKVGDIVREEAGVLIYSGGDDVLALLPAKKAIGCAVRLRDQFAKVAGDALTLTVGIGVSHVMDDLQGAVNFARSMEGIGKKLEGKNALAVGIRPRGGSDLSVAIPWGEKPQDTFKQYLELLGGQPQEGIPRGLPYELGKLAAEFEGMGHNPVHFKNEINRICDRKEPKPPDDFAPRSLETPEELEKHVNMLRIAHFLTRVGEED